jgi:hypothetical protein
MTRRNPNRQHHLHFAIYHRLGASLLDGLQKIGRGILAVIAVLGIAIGSLIILGAMKLGVMDT